MNNRKLADIASSPEGDTPRDHVETAMALGTGVEIAGRELLHRKRRGSCDNIIFAGGDAF